MSIINFKTILSCSNEDRVHCAENLLKPEQYKKWLSSKGTEQRIICILELEKPSFISSVDIGNDGSASIELLVSQSFSSKSDDWTVLLPSTILMTPSESRADTNRHQIKSLKSDHLNKICLNQQWDRLKIICEQKLNRVNQFGLNFIKLYSIAEEQIEKKSRLPHDELVNNNEIQTKTLQNDRSQIMETVSFVLSGFKNPLRSQLRNKATAMGAIYNDDWNEDCTHLICAFDKAPKSKQVQKSGKGFIVNKKWILDCYKQNQLLSEESYGLKKKTNEIEEFLDGKDVKIKSRVKRKSINNNEDEANELKIGEIPDFFHEKHFYVSYGDYDDNTLLDIIRVIFAYDGILEKQITSDVTYVITNRMWNQDFEKISKSNPQITFVNLDWLQDCHDANQFIPVQPYLIVP